MTESNALSDIMFFAFAAGIIGAAVSAVTIRSPKGAVFAFSVFCLCLGGLFYALSLPTLAIFQSALGVFTLLTYQIKFSFTGERANDKVRMLESPNQMVAIFVLLCFVMAVTPVWIYSIWSAQPGVPLVNIDATLFAKLSGEYFPAIAGLSLALTFITVFAVKIQRSKTLSNASTIEHNEPVAKPVAKGANS